MKRSQPADITCLYLGVIYRVHVRHPLRIRFAEKPFRLPRLPLELLVSAGHRDNYRVFVDGCIPGVTQWMRVLHFRTISVTNKLVKWTTNLISTMQSASEAELRASNAKPSKNEMFQVPLTVSSFKSVTCWFLYYQKVKGDFCVSDTTFGPSLCESSQFIMYTYLMSFVQ